MISKQALDQSKAAMDQAQAQLQSLHARCARNRPVALCLEAYIYVPIEHVAQLKSKLPVQIIDQSGKLGKLGWPPFMVHSLQPEFPC